MVKRSIKGILPDFIYKGILVLYRFFFSYIPNTVHKNHIHTVFTHRQNITIKDTPLRIVIDPKNGGTDAELFLHHQRDVDVIAIMKERLHRGSTFVDIGANIGYETLYGAHLVGDSGHVYAFEPIPHLVSQIKESIALNAFSNITVIEKAAGNKDGYETIYLHDEDAGLTSITNKNGASHSVSIDVTMLDKELAHIKNVDVIKLDVEGYEYEALQGGKNTIATYTPTIIFEFSPHLYEQDYKGKSIDILTFLDSLGYSIYAIDTLHTKIPKENFTSLIEKILIDETIPNFVATIEPISL